jgi:hypothetical protein
MTDETNSVLPSAPETISGTKEYTPLQRITYLKMLHKTGNESVQRLEIAILRNIIDMSEKDKAGIPLVEIQAALANIKVAHNNLNKLLNQATEVAKIEAPVRKD